MKTLTVSTSDIGHLAVFSMSVDSSSLVRELLYVDDCDIVAHSEDELQCFMNHFVSACNSFGLKINLKKTIVMYDLAPGSPYIEPIIFVEGNKLDVVHSFVYLGSTLPEGCSLDREISFHIERTSRFFSALNKRVWSQQLDKLHTKIIVYKVWRPSCMQAKLGHSINTNTNFLRVSINGAWDRYFISNGSPIFQIQKY